MDRDGDPQWDPLVTLVLEEYRKLKRGSKGVKGALETAKKADKNSLEGVILGLGDNAWRAFYAAKKATQAKHGFSGQAILRQLLNELTASPENYLAFAEQLASAMASNGEPTVENNAQPSVETSAQPSAGSSGTKRRRTNTDVYTTPSSTPNDLEHYSLQEPLNTASLKDLYIGAPLEHAEDLFHELFWDSIERIPSQENPGIWLADITIFSQKGDQRQHFGYQMEIGITPEKLKEYAFDYFGVDLEDKDGVRYIRYQGGAIIEPDPSIKLRVGKRDFSRIFKSELLDAQRSSPIYQHEDKMKLSRTNSVSMTISNQAKEGGKMTVFMGQWKALMIKEKFYG